MGVFFVAFYIKRIGANAVFYAALMAEAIVLIMYFSMDIKKPISILKYMIRSDCADHVLQYGYRLFVVQCDRMCRGRHSGLIDPDGVGSAEVVCLYYKLNDR